MNLQIDNTLKKILTIQYEIQSIITALQQIPVDKQGILLEQLKDDMNLSFRHLCDASQHIRLLSI